MNKKSILLASFLLGATVVGITSGYLVPTIIEANNTFTINLTEDSKNNLSSILENNQLVTERSGLINVEYANLSEKDGFWGVLGENGYFTNTTSISGLKSIEFVFEGQLSLDYKYIEQVGYNAKSGVTLTSGVSYNFNNEGPDIFKFYTSEGASIERVTFTYSCSKVEINPDLTYTDIKPYEDVYEYADAPYTFEDFDESTWNLNLRFELSEDGTYYKVGDYPAGDRLLNNPTLVIPAYYKGLPVKEIIQARDEVGSFCELEWLKTVYLPPTIERIGYGTFSLTHLEHVYIDCENLEDMHGRNWVFYAPQSDSYKGMNVYFGPSVKRIPERLFYPNVTETGYTPKINNVYFDDNCQLEEIGSHAFHDVTTLKTINLPDTVKTIGEYAFYKTSIEEIVLPSALESIANDAFSFTKISHIKVNDKLSYIGDRAFYYCELTAIDLSKTNITHIEDECFAYTKNLKHINFPTTLIDIGERAFTHSGIEEINLPDSVTIIRKNAFYANESLKKLYLGENIQTICNGAFAYTINLNEIIYNISDLIDLPSGNQVFISSGINTTLNVYIKDGVKKLPKNLFFATSNVNELMNINCLSLSTSLIYIGAYAFLGIDINRVNYRGTMSEYASLVCEDGYTFNNVDFGGRSNA